MAQTWFVANSESFVKMLQCRWRIEPQLIQNLKVNRIKLLSGFEVLLNLQCSVIIFNIRTFEMFLTAMPLGILTLGSREALYLWWWTLCFILECCDLNHLRLLCYSVFESKQIHLLGSLLKRCIMVMVNPDICEWQNQKQNITVTVEENVFKNVIAVYEISQEKWIL